ncbi:hypothetical protein NXV12_20845 [Bacteroides thetaiotaomicron]|nr:hypothetical protein [Bacteroides thetaiotaomicron]
MMHDGKYIHTARNEQELFNRYLDNNEYGPLKERLELVRKALSNKLSRMNAISTG